MKCGICNRDTELGQFYSFFYGKLLESSSAYKDYNTKTVTSTYKIDNSDSVYICHKCVIDRNNLPKPLTMIMSFVFMTLFGVGAMFGAYQSFISGQKGTAVFLAILGIGSLALARFGIRSFFKMKDIRKRGGDKALYEYIFEQAKIETVEELGDKMAISKKKNEFTRLGYDSFFTRAQHKRLLYK